MEILIKAVQFFLCLSLLVGIHEFGHFIMARIFKIRVEKFYIFFDPWFSLFKFKRKGTEYGLGWLPLGGYVKIAGMIDESMDKEQMKQPAKEDEFRSKPAWQRFLVMIAGVVMNLILAIFVYIGISYTWGDSYFANKDAKWGYVFNETGHKLGFEDGDKLVSIDGEPIDNYRTVVSDLVLTDQDRTISIVRGGQSIELVLPFEKLVEMRQNKGHEGFIEPFLPFIVDSVGSQTAISAGMMAGDQIVGVNDLQGVDYSAIREYIAEQSGDSVILSIIRAGQPLQIKAPISAEGRLGVVAAGPAKLFELSTRDYTLVEAIPAGVVKAGGVIESYWGQLKLMVQPKTKLHEELGGFISIGNIFPAQWDWYGFWMTTAFLSIILAVMNILPIPGLDGGHALFTFWEMVTGRKPSEKFLEIAQYIGMAILLLLLLYANGNDIYRFFIK